MIEYEYDRRRPMVYILLILNSKKSEYVNGDAAYANRKAFVTAKICRKEMAKTKQLRIVQMMQNQKHLFGGLIIITSLLMQKAKSYLRTN